MSDAAKPTDIVVSARGGETGPRQVMGKRRLTVLISVCSVVLLLIVGTILYVAINTGATGPKVKVTADDLSDDYGVLTTDQITRKFEAKTGIDINNITDKSISSRRLKNFDNAYQAGQALYALKKYDRSVQAYEIAESKATPAQSNYVFYQSYSDAAQADKQTDRSSELLDKAIAAIKSDASLSTSKKSDEIARIDQVKRLRKLGY